MKARVLISFFSEGISGTADTIIEIPNQKLFDDLLKAGYIEAIASPKKDKNKKVTDSE